MSDCPHNIRLPVHLRRVKRACKYLQEEVGTQEDAAGVIVRGTPYRDRKAVRQQRVDEMVNLNTPVFLPLDELLALEDDARGSENWPQVTRALASHHGFALLPLAAAIAGDTSLHRSLGEVSKETGEVVNKVLNALADGTLTPDEIRDLAIADEIRDAIAALARLLGLVEAIADQGGASPVPHLKVC